jgi:hypothetical protein
MQLREDFLHYVWRFKQFDFSQLKTTNGENIEIFQFGQYNTDGGPDFTNAQIQIGKTLWAGNVEVHIKASDWLKHMHGKNLAYNNVILHVVFEADTVITNSVGQPIPTLELNGRISLKLKNTYLKLLHEKAWIPCANQIGSVPDFTKTIWLDRMLIERLEQKTTIIAEALERNNNDWETTFYQMVARSFGLKINVEPFERLAQTIPLITLGKHKNSLFQLEALLFGQSGFLSGDFKEDYPNQLKKEYEFLKHKYQLTGIPKTMWQFLRLRPPSFPTIRIAQFAALIHQSSHLFSKILEAENIETIERLFEVQVSDYWQCHYVLDKESQKRKKSVGSSTVQLIIINTIIPALFLYGKFKSEERYKDKALKFLEQLPAENNKIIDEWQSLGFKANSAYHTQALLQLKKQYCDKKNCLSCSIGNSILKQ